MASFPTDNPYPVVSPADASSVDTQSSDKRSYRQILKSSALIGGSSVVNIAIGIVRTKAMAALLGPSGFGLFGLYGSIIDLVQSIAGMGVNSSGVRQIAEGVSSGDLDRVARTTAVLRKTSLVLGVIGAVLLVAFSKQVSTLTFGSNTHWLAICMLASAVFFRLVSGGQAALIQGMRRISDLARMNVLGAFFGALISIPVVYVFRENGIVPSLVIVAAMTIVTSWWYSQKIEIQVPTITTSEMRREVAPLLKLGIAFMVTGLMTLGSGYVVRIIVLRKLGFEAIGFFQSAWTLGGLYVSFILQAMAADFYPRLTATASDHPACNRMVNEQARVGLLLAGPGTIATLTFAPLVISLLYSNRFLPAIEILRWICLGATLQVITWPMGFISLAKGRSSIFFWCDFAWTFVYLSLTWVCVKSFGVNGTGIAFFLSYVFHAFLMYPVSRRLTGFRWSAENRVTGLLVISLVTVTFCAFRVLPFLVAVWVGIAALTLSCAYSVRTLASFVSEDQVPRPLRRVLRAFERYFPSEQTVSRATHHD